MVFSNEKQQAMANAIIALLTEHGPRRCAELVTLLVTNYRVTLNDNQDFRDVDESNIMPVLKSIEDRLFRYQIEGGGIQGAPYITTGFARRLIRTTAFAEYINVDKHFYIVLFKNVCSSFLYTKYIHIF